MTDALTRAFVDALAAQLPVVTERVKAARILIAAKRERVEQREAA